MAKYNIYAVGYGIDPNTKEPVFGVKCRTWNECQEYTKGVDGAKFKGFQTDAEADIWMEEIRKTMLDKAFSEALNADIDKGFLFNDEFVKICKKLDITPVETCLMLQIQFVEQYKFVNKKKS